MKSARYEFQKNFWESVRERRAATHPVVSTFVDRKVQKLLSFVPELRDSRPTMLEIGAGNGFFSRSLNEHFEVSCLDFSERMISMHPFPGAYKIVGDAAKLPFRDNAFDVVFCGNLLHHLEDVDLAVREMKRVAAKHVFIVEPNALNPLMFAFGAVVKEERGTLKFFPSYIPTLAKKAGMRVRASISHGMILPNKLPEKLLPLVKKFDGSWWFGFYNLVVLDIVS